MQRTDQQPALLVFIPSTTAKVIRIEDPYDMLILQNTNKHQFSRSEELLMQKNEY